MAGLFSRFKNTNNQPADDGSAGQPMILEVNDISVTVPADQTNQPLRTLFSKFLSDQVSVENLNSFVVSGRIVNGATQGAPGMIVRAAATSDTKG
jgi:hypothetical protein